MTWTKVQDLTFRVDNSYTSRTIAVTDDYNQIFLKAATSNAIYKYNSTTNPPNGLVTEYLSDAEVSAIMPSLGSISHFTWFDDALYFVAFSVATGGVVFRSDSAGNVVEEFVANDHIPEPHPDTDFVPTEYFLGVVGGKLLYVMFVGTHAAVVGTDDFSAFWTAYKSGGTWTVTNDAGDYDPRGNSLLDEDNITHEVSLDTNSFSLKGFSFVGLWYGSFVGGTPHLHNEYADDNPVLFTWNGTGWDTTPNFALDYNSGPTQEHWMTGPDTHWVKAPTVDGTGGGTPGTFSNNLTSESTMNLNLYRCHQIGFLNSFGYRTDLVESVTRARYYEKSAGNWTLRFYEVDPPPLSNMSATGLAPIVWRNDQGEVMIIVAPNAGVNSDIYKWDQIYSLGGSPCEDYAIFYYGIETPLERGTLPFCGVNPGALAVSADGIAIIGGNIVNEGEELSSSVVYTEAPYNDFEDISDIIPLDAGVSSIKII